VLPVTRFLSFDFSNVEGLFRLLGNSLLPVASENILATYLAFVGGPFASLIYRGELAAFEWLSPVLPNLDWILSTFLGTIVPVLGVLFVREMIEWRSSNETASNPREKWGSAWILTSIVLVFLLWFNSGLFAIRPTLVSGISMEPAIKPGDIAITREISADGIKTGDVVLFNDGAYSVLHRVVEIRWLDGNRIFFTKGDNVNVLDNPWGESQLKGKMVMVIPKLGWIPIGMKMLVNQIVH
jgi:signal peptidase